jgi:hypothetical protein
MRAMRTSERLPRYVALGEIMFSKYEVKSKGKGKVRPRKGHDGPEGEYRYSSILPLTSALIGGEWLTPRPGRSAPGKETPIPIF